MPATQDIWITGATAMIDRLKALSVRTQTRLAWSATAAASRKVMRSAQANIESYGLIDTGALIGNVAIARIRRRGDDFSYAIGVRHGTFAQVKEDDNPFYWWMLEFGTVKRPGTPFLTVAFEQEKEASLNLMRDSLVRGIERTLRQGRR